MVVVKQVKAWRSGVPEATAAVRDTVVQSVMAGLRAAQLSSAEYLAVVGAIQVALATMETEKTALVLTASSVVPLGAEVSKGYLESIVVETPVAGMAAETLVALAAEASPGMWSELRAILESSDEELRARLRQYGEPDAAGEGARAGDSAARGSVAGGARDRSHDRRRADKSPSTTGDE